MAAGTLPAIGTKYGPCKEPCEHRDCAMTRKMAAMTCHHCDKVIGYETLFYEDGQDLVHALCEETAIERERPAR